MITTAVDVQEVCMVISTPRRGPNAPYPLRSVVRDKSLLTIMISMMMTKEFLTRVPVTVGEHPVAERSRIVLKCHSFTPQGHYKLE